MIINKLCPYCMCERNVKRVAQPETIKVRGQDITVDSRWLVCTTCEGAYDDPLDDFDVLAVAYDKYNALNPNNRIEIKK